jgi:dUTP pyrophosphatase
MEVLFKRLHPDAVIPQYQTEHSAGMDVCAAIDAPMTLRHLERTIVPCGFAMAIPEGYEIQVRARSGLAAKHGIGLVNGIGTIDADYRGELGIILINYGTNDFVIQNGDRIAQIVLAKYERANWRIVEALDQTERSDGGFGSTGLQKTPFKKTV